MTVRVPPKRILKRAIEVAERMGWRVWVTPSGFCECIKPNGSKLDEAAIDQQATTGDTRCVT